MMLGSGARGARRDHESVASQCPETLLDSGCTVLPSFRISIIQIIIVILGLGRCPAELGPETRSNGSGSENIAERPPNDSRIPILKPFREHVVVRAQLEL